MARKRLWLGILIMVLAFCMPVVGCDDILNNDDDSNTLEFMVENNYVDPPDVKTITKIEFINGWDFDSDPVLQTEIVNISPGEASRIYKVSGFTKKAGFGGYEFCVAVTVDDDYTIHFNKSSTGGKIIKITFTYGGLSML